jgi:Virulence protein
MLSKTLQIRNSTAEFLLFTKQAGENGIEVRVQDGTIWLSQKLMAALFDCTIENVIIHLKNIFADGELDENSVTKDFLVTAADSKNYRTKHYNLDAIIAIGYRINTKRTTASRKRSRRLAQSSIVMGICFFARSSAKSRYALTMRPKDSNSVSVR